MKYRLFISLLAITASAGLPGIVFAQSFDKNHILTQTYYDIEGNVSVSQIDYFDSYGRSEQTVFHDYPNQGSDMVTLQEYDNRGLPTQKWIPMAKSGNRGLYVSRDFFIESDEACYEATQYEANDRARPMKVIPAGAPFNERSSDYQYLSSPQDSVINYSVSPKGKLYRSLNLIGSGAIISGGAFCYTTHTTDGDGKKVLQFYDVNGQLILTRQYDGDKQADTYQVYNSFGELCYILPPQASILLKTALEYGDIADDHPALLKFGYHYRYDNYGNRIFIRLPGAEPLYQAYDKSGRMVLSQDGQQREKSHWTYYTYDLRGRMLYKAIVSCSMSLDEAMRQMENKVLTQKYDFGNSSLSPFQVHYRFEAPRGFQLEQILVAYYYDNYRFRQNMGLESILEFQNHFSDPLYIGNSCSGLLTGKQVFSLDDKQLFSVQMYYYNRLDQQIQVSEKNFWGHCNHIYKKYDLTGRLLSEHRSTGIANDNQAYEKYDYQYDFADNCTRIGYDINTGPLPQTSAMETLVVRLYDGKNRLSNRIQGDSFYGNLEYKYAPGGQLTQITGWNFEENLFYGQAPGSSSCASYNGNLSARIWSYKNTNEESMHGYRYYYDSMNRLKQAVSTIGKEQIRETNEYNEEYSYDLQGNILSLQRNGGPRLLIDDLHLTYDGNQLKSISDHSHSTDRYDVKEYHDANESSEEFAYNANGCLNKDLDRKISSIQYNCLNLPDTVLFDNGNQLVFRYDGEGNKWEEHSFTVTTPLFVPVEKALRSVSGMSFSHKASTAWSGNLECESVSGGNYKLSKVHHPEGYIEKFSWSSALYNMYYRHDYQGNVREVWRYPNPGVPAATVQYIQYYPGGMPWAESDNAAYQSRKYSGKRYLEMHGYDSYDFMARTYAPDYNRFTTMDPLCEKYYGVSPYAYCMGNPVTFVDPDGRKVVIGSLLGRIAAFFGADNFESHVKSQIEELKEADKEVKSMIEKMEDSKFEVKIVPTALTGEKSSNSTLRNHKNASIKQGSTIYYNQNSQSTQSGKRPPIVGLAHELGHADDYINGRGINLNKKDVTNKKKDIQNAEEHAIEVENKVRKALDIPLRPLDYFAK